MSNNQPTTFKISAINPELFSLGKVAMSPRSLSPLDLASASKNVSVEFSSLNPPQEVDAFLKYLFLDFFVNSHSTGLYNRQFELWESIAKVSTGSFETVMSGWIFSKKETPLVEISFQDTAGRPIIIAWLLREYVEEDQLKELNVYFNNFVKKINKIRLSENNLKGTFFGLPRNVDESFLERFKKLVNASDPVAKYESRLPEPASVPLNLVGFESLEPKEQSSDNEEETPWILQPSSLQVELIHPFLPVRKNSRIKK